MSAKRHFLDTLSPVSLPRPRPHETQEGPEGGRKWNSHGFLAYVGFSDQVQPRPGLLGIRGFFDKFKVTFDIHREAIEINPYR